MNKINKGFLFEPLSIIAVGFVLFFTYFNDWNNKVIVFQ